MPDLQGWSVARIDRELDYVKDAATAESLNGKQVFHYSIPVVAATGDGQLEDGSEIDSNKFLLRGDELLVSKLNPHKGHVLLTQPNPRPIVCSTEYLPLRPKRGDRRFFRYYFESSHSRQRIVALCQSATRSHMRARPDEMLKIWDPVPSPAIQASIADFLDRKTTAIDVLIAKKERLIELLQEKRQALIIQAVTKGLDPSVPMKESGVEWIGRVPRHWDSVLLRRVAQLESGHTPSREHPEYWVPTACTTPWFGLADVWQLRSGETIYVHETEERVSDAGLANSSARLLPAGTVMLSRTASVGFSGIMGVPMATTQDFANWVPGDRIDSEYLLCVFPLY